MKPMPVQVITGLYLLPSGDLSRRTETIGHVICEASLDLHPFKAGTVGYPANMRVVVLLESKAREGV